MKIQTRFATLCVLASLITSGITIGACAGGSSETSATSNTTPAAAAGDPATPAPPAPATTPAPVATQPVPADQTATPAANTTQPPMVKPTVGAMVTHKVKDFATWKTAFDADLEARKQASVVGHGIMTDPTSDKTVSIWLAATDAAKLKAFFASPTLKETMKNAGVQGKPTIEIMNTVGDKMDPSKTGLSAVMLKATVKDFAAFKTAFDQGEAARETAGLVGYGLGQGVDDAKLAYVYLQSDDAAKLKAYVDSKDTKKAWKDAGVVGQPKSQYVKEGEMSMYQQ